MMKLSLMQALEDTLSESYQSDIANQIIAAWPHDRGTVQYFRASANFVFVFCSNGQPFILRFTHASERSADAIRAELGYLQYLATHGVPVALPVQSLSGQYVETITTPLGVVHAVVFERLAGEQFETGNLSLEQFTRWGDALGRLHLAAQGYTTSSRSTIDNHLAYIEQHLPPHEHAARDIHARLHHQVAELPRSEQTFGLVHYDFELDNLLWNGDQIAIVDFDDCAYYWFVADIAFALRDLFDDQAANITIDNERFQAFLSGYCTIRPIARDELLHLPLFLRIHNLVSFVKLLQAADASNEPNMPEWVARLQAKLVQKAQRYRDSFATYAT